MGARTLLLLAVPIAALLLAACGDLEEDVDEPPPRETARPTVEATATPSVPPATATPAPDAGAPSISAIEFCEQAQLTITRWELPPTLTGDIQTGSIELRYRLPPGVETLVVWMGVTIEVGDVSIGDVVRLDPSLAASFPNADPDAAIPATIPSHGFDLAFDSRLHTMEVAITLPPESSFDQAAPWRWSALSPPPFAVGEPWILATFRAEGVRVRMDGRYCTPLIPPLP